MSSLKEEGRRDRSGPAMVARSNTLQDNMLSAGIAAIPFGLARIPVRAGAVTR